MKIPFLFFGLFLSVIFPSAKTLAQGFGAFPISQAVEIAAGRSTTLSFELLNFGADPMDLEVAHSYVPSQLTEDQIESIGNQRLRQLMRDRPQDHSAWMTIPSEITLDGSGSGGPTVLTIPIDVPATASGTVTGTIIFTQKTDALLRLAYRCSYLLTVTNRPLVREIILDNVEIEQVAGETAFSATVTNIGNTGFDISGDYALFRQIGLRKIPVLKDSLEPVSLQPGQPTTVASTFANSLASGRYELRLSAALSGAVQRPRVLGFDFEGPFDAGSSLADSEVFAAPNLALITLGPRARRNIPYVFENRGSEPVEVSLSLAGEPAPGMAVQVIPESLTISPASSGRFRLVAQASEDFSLAEPQSLNLRALTSSQSGTVREQGLELWVSTAQTPPAPALSLDRAKLDLTAGVLRFDLSNTGNVPASPMGEVTVFVRPDQPLAQLPFRVDALLAPGQQRTVVLSLDAAQRSALDELSSLSAAIDVSLGMHVHHPRTTGDARLVVTLAR